MNAKVPRLDEALTAGHGVYFSATRLIDSHTSPFQTIEVFETADLGRLMRLDGCNMVSEADEFLYHEPLIHPAALAHPAPRSALIIGGGDGGAAEELLKHDAIAQVTLCELDAEVVAMARAHFGAVHRGAFDEERVRLVIGDGLAFAAEQRAACDLVFLDLTDPLGPAAALYGEEAYRRFANALAPGGILVTHIGSPFSHPARVGTAMRELRQVFRHVSACFVHIPIYGALWGFALASDKVDAAALDGASWDARRVARVRGALQWADGATLAAAFTLPPWIGGVVAGRSSATGVQHGA
ncbi:MAG: polyamine aminopropyltransferase [Burkholderiales bacterium]|nr:polyamine aminopropyltransferase [Burkholderiales bacterium]